MIGRCPGSMAAKQTYFISPPPPCEIVGMRCLCRYNGFGSHGRISVSGERLHFGVVDENNFLAAPKKPFLVYFSNCMHILIFNMSER